MGNPPEAFFTPDGAELLPSRHAVGPWGADTMNGQMIGGVVARSLELDHGDPAFLPARLTVDMLRPTALAPVPVTTERIREGRRIRIADAVISQNGKMVARASAVFLRRSKQPPGEVWTPDEPLPAAPWAGPSAEHLTFFPYSEDRGYGDHPDISVWTGTSRKGAWFRESRPLVEGEELTPFVRAALAGDVTSPLTHWGTEALQFINVDYTLALSRLPSGHDIGMRASTHLSAEGVATGSATFFDRLGPIGTCTVLALANPTDAFHIPPPPGPGAPPG